MSAIFYGLISYIGWGTGDIFGTYATRKVGPYVTTFWAFAFGALLGSLYIPFALSDLSAFTPQLLLINILLGVLYVGGNLMFNEALRLSSAPIVGTIGGSFSALTVLLSFVFLGEKISFIHTILIVVVFTGVYITTTAHGQKHDANAKRGITLAFLSFIVWGTYFTFLKVIMHSVGWFWPNYIPILLFPMIGVYMKWKKIPFLIPKIGVMTPLFFNALLLRGGDFAFNIGASLGLTATVAPFGGSYPTLFALLSHLVFHDPLSYKQIVGILIALTGLVALGFTGTV